MNAPRGTFRKTTWQAEQRRRFQMENGYSTKAHYDTGGLRKAVLERDSYSCVRCKMTDSEHKAKWGRPITVDHKDRNRKNNTMDNLQTLCLTCHGKKDISKRVTESKIAPFKEEIISLYLAGVSANQIAIRYGTWCKVITKWLRRWEVLV